MTEPLRHDRVEDCVETLLERIGPVLRVGIPLGIGKPNQLVNELFVRARRDSSLQLELFTALSLEPPTWSSELERRLVEPLRERLYSGWPELDYVRDRRRGELPENVRIVEFYFPPGKLLGNRTAQSDYISTNYGSVSEELRRRGLDVVAQLVVPEPESPGGAERRLSLSSNPDLTLDLLPYLEERRANGEPVALVGQTNRELPYMPGDAVLEAADFDHLIESPELDFPPFGAPNEPLGTTDWLVGLWTSGLVRDGGTVQLGIGTLSDAVCHLLVERHRRNESYSSLLAEADLHGSREEVLRIGGDRPFERGLFANTEMLVEGLLELHRAGVLSRRVYPDAGLQRAVDSLGPSADPGTPDGTLLRALVEVEAIPVEWDEATISRLRALGILAPDVELVEGRLHRDGVEPAAARVVTESDLEAIAGRFLGPRLRGGALAHAGFFFGSQAFYQGLRELPLETRRELEMTRISWTNRLDGDRKLKEAQRRHARFINETMMVTALGAAVSDGLEDGRVVSGVGGQQDFVTMAHRLPEARSILMLPATRDDGHDLRSNVRWSYGHTTIPRQQRDLVVTEYGVADLRGKTDREVVEAQLAITDARFQREIVERAQEAGKLPRSYRLPDRYRTNRPERLEKLLTPYRESGLCPQFPLGSDLEPVEVDLVRALRSLRSLQGRRVLAPQRLLALARDAARTLTIPAAARPYLDRMELERPRGLSERLQRRAVLLGLARLGLI